MYVVTVTMACIIFHCIGVGSSGRVEKSLAVNHSCHAYIYILYHRIVTIVKPLYCIIECIL